MRLKIAFLASCLLILLVLSVPARAADTPEEIEIEGVSCQNDSNIKKNMLAEAIFICIKDKMNHMADNMVTDIFNKSSKAINALLLLAVISFAIKYILFGTRQPQAEFFAMLLKMIIVSSLLFGIRTGGGILVLRDTILNTASDLQNVVLTTNGFGIVGGNIFAKMDSTLCQIYGISDPATKKCKDTIKSDKDMAGIGMMGGLMLAGPLGAKAFIDGGAAVGMLVGAFMAALYINVVALIALTFLFTLSPIMLPLMLFKATERMFQKWRGQLISYSIQPMIMTVFISLMFIILGNLVGTLGNFIDAARAMSNNPGVRLIKTGMSTSTKVEGGNKDNVAVNTGTRIIPETGDTIAGQLLAGAGNGEQKNMLSLGIATKEISVPVIPFGKKQLNDLGSNMVVLLVTCAAMLKFMKQLPSWAAYLAGDGLVPNLATSAPVQQFEQNK